MIKGKVNTTRFTLFELFSFITVSYISIVNVFPPLRVLNGTLLTTITMIGWLVLSFINNSNFYIRPTYHRFYSLFFMVYSFIIPYLFNDPVIANRFIGVAPIFFYYIVWDYHTTTNLERNNIRIIMTTIPFLSFTIYRTLSGLISSPYLSRSIKSTGGYSTSLLKQGIGGYELIYFLVFLVPLLLYCITSNKILIKNKHRIFLIFFTLMCFFTVVAANYFTALLTLLVSIISLIAIKKTTQKKYRVVLLFLIIISFPLFLIFIENIALNFLNFILLLLPEGLNTSRIQEIKNGITNETGTISTSRWSLIRLSWNTFLRYPFFGIISSKLPSSVYLNERIGQHSHIIDTFAFLGFFPACIQIYVIIQPYMVRIKEGIANELVISIFLSVIIIFTFNSITPSMGFAISFILPTIYQEARNNTRKLKRNDNKS